jgi:predicted nucleotidyltransferase
MASWKIQPVHASLFGSAARGDGDERSDIDLLLVRPADTDADESRWRHQLDTLAELVRKWSGNHCALIELGERELPRLRRDRPPVVDEVMADAVDLAGKSARQILRPM